MLPVLKANVEKFTRLLVPSQVIKNPLTNLGEKTSSCRYGS